MTSEEVDAYLAAVDEPARTTLGALRATLLALLPDAEEGLAYGSPALRVRGTLVAGFAAFTDHLGYLPFSGSVVAGLGDALAGYRTTKGSVSFAVDEPLPRVVVEALVSARLAELPPA